MNNEHQEPDPRFPAAGTVLHDKEHGDFTYKYYIFSDFMLLRVSVVKDGGLFHIETPNKDGVFVTNMKYISQFSSNYPDTEEVTPEQARQFFLDRQSKNSGMGR